MSQKRAFWYQIVLALLQIPICIVTYPSLTSIVAAVGVVVCLWFAVSISVRYHRRRRAMERLDPK